MQQQLIHYRRFPSVEYAITNQSQYKPSMHKKDKMEAFLQPCKYVNYNHPDIQALAKSLKSDETLSTINNCFIWVRDNIKHSIDYQMNPVTCIAYDVLKHGTGFCYAKSHLLAALLRVNGVPTGLCYQRLSLNDDGAPYCLHGLNAVFTEQFGWIRIDARGNNEQVNALFDPPEEYLAFATNDPEEAMLPEIWTEPLPVVTQVLESCNTYEEVIANIPDILLLR